MRFVLLGPRVSPLPNRLNHLISRFVRGTAITKQIGKVGRESGTFALLETKDFSRELEQRLLHAS